MKMILVVMFCCLGALASAEPSPENVHRVCTGEYERVCAGRYELYRGCNSDGSLPDTHQVAREICTTNSGVVLPFKISARLSFGGNKCGYVFFTVICSSITLSGPTQVKANGDPIEFVITEGRAPFLCVVEQGGGTAKAIGNACVYSPSTAAGPTRLRVIDSQGDTTKIEFAVEY